MTRMFSAVVLFIVLAGITCSDSFPLKHQAAQDTTGQWNKDDTKILLDLLAKLMNTRDHDRADTATTNGNTMCAGLTSLSLAQLHKLLGTSTGNSVSETYVIAGDGYVFHGTTEHNPYSEFLTEYSYYPPPSSVWLNTAPCAQCANELIQTYDGLTERPTIYVESFNHNITNYEAIEGKVGCLAKLQSSNFSLKAWNWTEFSKFFTEDQCQDAITNFVGNTNYSIRKENFEHFMDLINQLSSDNEINKWCI